MTYNIETSVTLKAPTKSHYTFGGWFDNDEFEDEAITSIAVGNTGNETFYAKWTFIEHDFTQLGTQISLANCTTPAKHKAKCSVGGEESETLVLDGAAALNHDYAWTAKTPATCKAKAVEDGTCSRDNLHTTTREVGEINATAHAYVYGEWVTTLQPSNTAVGSKTRTVACSNDATHTFPNEVQAIDMTAITDIKKANGMMLFKSTIVSDKMELNLGDEFRDVKFVVYDFTGNIVSEGVQGGDRKATLVWDLKNRSGRFVANGSYLVVVEAKDKSGKRVRYSAKLGVKR